MVAGSSGGACAAAAFSRACSGVLAPGMTVVTSGHMRIVAGAWTYANTFTHPFLIDDTSSVVNNPTIRDLSSWSVFQPPANHPMSGRPLVNLSFALNYAAGGTDVWGYHAVSLALHLVCGLLVFGLAGRQLSTPRAGAVALLWSSLSLFSALESAFNIIYGRPNRPFVRGKVLAIGYMTVALLVLFAALTAGTLGYDLLRRYATDVISNQWVALALTLLSSGLALFVFLLSAYYRLPNARLTRLEVLPGAILGAVVLAGTLQALPLFVSFSSEVVALQALGTTFLLLIWLYVMANVIVFGAALNYVLTYGLTGRVVEPKRPEERDVAMAS